MTWDEINGDTWNIPAARRKGRTAHSVPLCSLALEILNEARLISGQSVFVFQSPQGGADRPTERLSLSRAVSRHLQECGFNEAWTPHDLRRTVRTGLAELGIGDLVAEQVLGHKIGGIMGVYNQHSYATEKRQALEKWERHIRRIVGIEVEEGKVIPLRRAVG
jgi:integrase